MQEEEDSGAGILGDAQTEIFRAFEQESEGMDREYEGTGLGLSIVRRLVGLQEWDDRGREREGGGGRKFDYTARDHFPDGVI